MSLKKFLFLNKLFFLVFFILYSFRAFSQNPVKLRSTTSAVGTTGNIQYRNERLYIAQSVGQASVINKYNAQGVTLRQGFIQPLSKASSEISKESLKGMIYPNPFINELIVSFSDAVSDELLVSIYNSQGNLVHSDRQNAHQEIHLDLTNLLRGIYFLVVTTNNKQFSSHLIKE